VIFMVLRMYYATLARVILAFALGGTAVASAAEEYWSRFRGPNGGGVVDGVRFPAKWTSDDLLWRVEISGKGHSSPIAWDDRVFVTSADQETGTITVTSLDAATGKSLWSREVTAAPHHLHLANSFASSTPVADSQRVYLTWASSGTLMAAAWSHTGEEAWRRELGPLEYKHGYGGSPVLVDGMLVVANDNLSESFVAALDARSGEPRWRQARAAGTESYATPAVWQASDGSNQIIVHSTAEGMTALAAADGRIAWQLKDVFPVRCVGSPIVAGGLLFGTSGEGGNGKNLTAVRPPDSPRGQAEVAYQLGKSLPQVPTPVAQGDLLFVWSDRGVASCYDLTTGKQHWTERVEGNYHGSPVIAGDRLHCIAADATGDVVTLAASKRFEALGRSPLGEPSRATPMIHAGKMYLRTETSLACLPHE
jgi:outer membrane protein assembly factor BamB